MKSRGVAFHRSLGARTLLLAVLPTVAILMGIIIYTTLSLSSQVRDQAEGSLQGLAQHVAGEIERSNAQAVLTARMMAHAQTGGGLFGQREASTRLARQVLTDNSDLTGAYFGYEPDADGQDAVYRDPATAAELALAHDGSGRFLPYWYRDAHDNSKIRLTPLVDMESSLYYQGTKDLFRARGDGHSMVTEPYVYEGKMIVEQVHPIVIDGRFRGVAGVDRALTDITTFIEGIKERAGVDILLISRTRRFIASTTGERASLVTRHVGETVYDSLLAPLLVDRNQETISLSTDPTDGMEYYFATAPVPTGTWTVVVRKLEGSVTAPIRRNLVINVLIALVGLVAVIVLSLWTTGATTRRLQRAVYAADTVASGDLSADVHLEDEGGDEVASLLASLRRMVQSLDHKMGIIDSISHGDYTRQVEIASDHDVLGQSLQEMSDSLRQIVEHCGRIAAGDYEQLLDSRSDADELVHSLNRMTQALADSHDRLEQRVQQRTDQLNEHTRELEARTQQLQQLTEKTQAQVAEESSLSTLTARLQASPELVEVARNALDEIVSFLQIPAGAVYVPEADGRLHRCAAHALPPEADELTSFAPGTGSVGQAAQSHQVSVFRSADEAWSLSFGLMQVPPRRVMTIPLLASDVLAGVLELYLLADFEEEQSAWLNKACGITAVSLRLANQSREREVAEEQTRLILESSGEGVFGLDTEGRATFVNPVACQLLGYEAEELIGEGTHAIIHHSHADGSPYPAAGCPMREAFTKGVITRVDDEVLWHKDGHAIPVEYTSTPILKDDAILGAVISFRDTTERRDAQARLQAREEQFRNLLDSAPDAMVISDTQGLITMVNRQTEVLFGYQREELMGQPVEILMPERFRESHPQRRDGFLLNSSSRPMGAGMELLAVTKGGHEFPIEVSLSPIETDEGKMVASALRDISQRTEDARALRVNQERLAALFEALPVGVVMIDPDGQIVQANGLTESILGVSSDAHKMRDLQSQEWRIVREDGTAMPVEEYPASRAMSGEGEIRNVLMGVHRPQGDLVWISTSAAPIAADAGGGVAVAFEDVTEQREHQRRESLLSRLRQVVWDLDSSSSTADLLTPLREVLDDSGVPYRALGVNVIDADGQRVRTFTAREGGVIDEIMPADVAATVIGFAQRGETANRVDLMEEDSFSELSRRDDGTAWEGLGQPRSIIDVPFSHGTLAANSDEPGAFTPHIELLELIAGVLSEGFRRLDDLHSHDQDPKETS